MQLSAKQQDSYPEDQPLSLNEGFNCMFNAQKEAFLKNPNPNAKERVQTLKKLKKLVFANQDAIADAICSDFGHRSKTESFYAEIFTSLETLRHTAKHVKKWMKPSLRMPGPAFLPAWSKVYYQPLGVVGIIVPWNYPFFLMIGPMAYALAAGNRVIVRMSRCSPALASLLKQRISEYFDADQITLFTGDDVSGSTFTKKPWDHLLFTGSTVAGKHVLRSASDNLVPVTLELGGKSPVIISNEVPMKDAAQRIAFGKMLNSGQTCVAPDYVFCPEQRVDDFINEFKTAVSTMYPTLRDNPDFTGIENDHQYAHLTELLQDAESKNAKIIEINPANEDFSGVRKMAPRIILHATEDMLVMQKEIFGPLLPVLTYTSIDEAITYVNAHPRPLALYYFDYNNKNAEYVIQNTFSGGATVNDTMVHVAQENMPFGGVGPSGMGKYHGFEGFQTFTNPKGVLFKTRFNSGKIIYPPYNTLMHQTIASLFSKFGKYL